MLTDADKAWIKANTEELISGTGELIIRKRLLTTEPPASYDPDYGEVVDKTEEEYADLEFIGKVCWNVTEKLLFKVFGGETVADAIVHVPIADDVLAGDFLVIRDLVPWYEVVKLVEAPLQGFNAAAIRKTDRPT